MKSKTTLTCYAISAVALAAFCLDGWTPVWGQAGKPGAAGQAGAADSPLAAGSSGAPGGAGGYGGKGGRRGTSGTSGTARSNAVSRHYGILGRDAFRASGWNRPFSAGEIHKGIRKAVKNFQAAKTDAEKDAATKEMSTALSGYFDADLKNREEDIANIEARVKKLRAQIEKRRTAKQKIVELQIQVLINEADGLGFYNNRRRSELDPRRSYFGYGAGYGGTPSANTLRKSSLPLTVPKKSAGPSEKAKSK